MIDAFKWVPYNHSGSFFPQYTCMHTRHKVSSCKTIKDSTMKSSSSFSPAQQSPCTGGWNTPHEAATADKSGISTLSSIFSRNTAVYSITIKEFIISGNGAQVKAAVNHILSHKSMPDESDTWLLFLSLCIISRNSLLLFWLGFSSHLAQHLS